ncbi:DUF6058 family natural product biosynthesis protein [Thermomonas sp. HDW16]|uniref:DUF6058 family natural product biosynthesis protein n=1 Tax=Thermomonas sp. HDW16 TaxID=2714945 RepID=UPI00140AE1D5|nr:DUF6058 family natural product biosynthesis protein [Thermomonas sp. HDW16]QIL20572.1 hypothetical protein G7079_07385 [Thermomonas sp. HDW16]
MSEGTANQAYLDAHFLRLHAMAETAGISPARLRELVGAGMVPAPSYVATDSKLISAAFGALPCSGLIAGDYMHRDMHSWIALALDAVAEHGESEAKAALQQAFSTDMRTALVDLHRESISAPDCFHADGTPDDAALDTCIGSHWDAHLEGIFGICVRRPGDIATIANKETAQAMLGKLTDSGTRQQYSASEALVLHGLITRYAEACAPFSPVEYPRTSRKRYVEDLPKQLAG